MGVTAARKTMEVAKNLAHILAIELLSAGQALEFRRPLKTSAALEAAHARLRRDVPPYENDRAQYPDIEAANKIVGSGELLHVVEQTLGSEGVLS